MNDANCNNCGQPMQYIESRGVKDGKPGWMCVSGACKTRRNSAGASKKEK